MNKYVNILNEVISSKAWRICGKKNHLIRTEVVHSMGLSQSHSDGNQIFLRPMKLVVRNEPAFGYLFHLLLIQ